MYFLPQVKEAMQRIHDRGNIGKLILDVEKSPTPLVSNREVHHVSVSVFVFVYLLYKPTCKMPGLIIKKFLQT